MKKGVDHPRHQSYGYSRIHTPGGAGRTLMSLVLVGALFTGSVTGLNRLSDYVEHYEPLHYDPSPIRADHVRHKRSLPDEDHRVRLDFVAHGQRFQMELKRDHSVFHNDLSIHDNDDRPITHVLDTSHIYEGKLLDDPDSHCFGAIRDGVFDGQISTRRGTYFVERASRYAHIDLNSAHQAKPTTANPRYGRFGQMEPEPVVGNKTIHSVIYHEAHVNDPFRHGKYGQTQGGGCGVSDSVQKWMENIQISNEASLPSSSNASMDQAGQDEQEELPSVVPLYSNEIPKFKYSAEANDPLRRTKRSITSPNKKKSCSLYIQTDPLFWKHVHAQEGDDDKTQEEILSLIAQHVKAVNRIYSDTPFDGKYKHNGYQFEVQRIKIHNDSQCKSSGKVPADQNQFCIPNVDVSNFLNLHSKSNHEEFCLAYVFTYRDFTGGTLGLAWVASASGASGGICETYKRYTENINGVHHTAKRSLNTGIITFVNYNSRVPPKVSQLTLAHEIGHNFGSPHDYPQECRPGGLAGNYIMFASATSGDRDNNNKFSHCSKSNISAVLDAIADGQKPNCFTESDGAFCGNKIVEEGEECDCGFDDHECTETCCYPRKSAELTDEENKRNRCRRKPDTECSPSEGPCCSNRCQFTQRSERVQCKNEDDCTMAATCDGQQARCPRPLFKPDNITECHEGTQVCQEGVCQSSICLKFGLESCFLTSDIVQSKRELCELACRKPGASNNTCMSTTDLLGSGFIRPDDLTEGLTLRPGSPCDNFQGYCDVFLKCRKVDAEGPLVRLKNLILNEETLLTIREWVTEYWYVVLLSSIALVIFMAIFIRCCAIHTPSSNPHLPKNLHLTETLRRPVRSLQQKHYRPANPGHGQPNLQQNHHGSGAGPSRAPPPYPGTNAPGAPMPGPGHGYGEGRGHYNRSRSYDERQALGAVGGPAALNHAVPSGRDRRSGGHQGNRSSRIEMTPMR
ncbi:disintegrin and metalloproteinase domain-containing protein 10-like isoform X2 [Tigriopus californicus]|uniref:disintegrin and metalloproteinase domain-containing protein 10-like isoform X2 n=1 Tax=Tigriopus californicus TaxID=6832 RepID=UPI0027DA516B|nr:disintegrin and metalloproteinase domain-containing protein 10-like isoform X2 [Tigriopus californicus]|eukprot:TCALIF_04423-PA protein Name:"Similar to ADAM10 Disintegrin and metalloproteinase domain-containing protein 10 (Homo sapiens)" AED:0.03 eAED:0.03 QI:588/1/1/1/0.71/0.62/8/347/964